MIFFLHKTLKKSFFFVYFGIILVILRLDCLLFYYQHY